ncbi:MAG: radical SAM protein, partial [archaeon]
MNNFYDHSKWYDTVYPLLSNYGLWLRGGEINTLPKEEYGLRPFRVLFTRLSTYKDVVSSLTHSTLYQIAASIPDVFPDIAYLPPHNDARIFERDNVPWILGTQTKFSAKAFDLIGFSNSIVQEIMNIPKFLETSGIPLNRSERLEREDIPLVILGGVNSLYTTSIWGNDSWVDGVFIGCSTSEIRALLEICASGRKSGRIKKDILEELKYLPDFYAMDRRTTARNKERTRLEDQQILKKGIVPYDEEALGRGCLEISEGCRASCSFCAENWLRKPYKESNAPSLLEKAVSMKAEMGLERIDLSSFNFNMHSELYKILWDFSDFFKHVGLKSQRFDMLAMDPAMIEYEHAAGKSTFSCGLEGISARLRKYLNKNLDDKNLRKSLELVFKTKARELKIFLLSTGVEDDNDFAEFNRFLEVTREIKEAAHAKTRVIFSITPVVKFPWTPLEFDKAYIPDMHDNVISRIYREVEARQFEVRKAMGTNEYVVSQILVRASDDKIKKALLRAVNESGFTYYTAVREPFFSAFMKALNKEGVKIEKLFECSSFEDSMSKPWASVETGVNRRALWEIYKKNVHFVEVRMSLDKLKTQRPEFTVEQFKAKILRLKNDEVEKSLYVTVGEKGRGVFRKYFGIALARAIMKTEPSF